MIRYSLLCDKDHEFDGWFRSSSDFDAQAESGEIPCPYCGSAQIRKGLMAPAIPKKGAAEAREDAAKAQDQARKMGMMMMALRKHVEDNADYVGDQFPEVARRIHYGEEEKRDIYGEASLQEAAALVEEGVEVAPLPFKPRGN